MIEERLERQLRIVGWDQAVLADSQVGVLGDDDLLASFFVLSASALGINDVVVLAPRLDEYLAEVAGRLNPKFKLTFLEGYFTHPAMAEIFSESRVLVDLSAYGLANKLAVNAAFGLGKPLVRAFRYHGSRERGLNAYTYMRENYSGAPDFIVSPGNLPGPSRDDPVLDTVAAGVALEEVKNILMGWKVSTGPIGYRAPNGTAGSGPRALIVGAGALGNFVALGLAYSGVTDLTIMDPDRVEAANLNRQVFLYEAIGSGKAQTLAARINDRFGAGAKFAARYFDSETGISDFDVLFDCVDNFETRIVISQKCRAGRKLLVSGGTSATAGQAVFYDPAAGGPTPAELLGFEEIAASRKTMGAERTRASCRYVPEPSVIMTNQIIAGLMVDGYRLLLNGNTPRNVFYDSESDLRILS